MAWPPTTHQDVEDDLTNGHGWAGSLSQRFGLGEQAIPTPFLWVVGNYYSSAMNGLATSNVAIANNRLTLAPIYFPTAKAVDQMAVNITTAGSTTHLARLGIYNSDSAGLPTTVKVDAGTVAVDSTGIKTLTVSTTLVGLYWIAITSQSGSLTSVAVGGCPILGGVASATTAATTALGRSSTPATSALPDLTGDATVTGISVALPRVLLRAA